MTMTHTDHELSALEFRAQETADRQGKPCAIYNLNGAGRRLLVIRGVTEGAPVYAGPFQPQAPWKTQFPDFDDEGAALILAARGWSDKSWRNDTCPSFQLGGLMIFADYVAPALRECPETLERFTVIQLDSDGCITDNSNSFETLGAALEHCDAFSLARRFSDLLREELTAPEFADVLKRNATPEYAGAVCASHDFRDANEVMAQAFLETVGREARTTCEADSALWSRAWSIAKGAQFFAPESGK